MKKSFLLLSLFVTGANLFAQQVPNNSFENWSSYAPLAPSIYDPNGWASFNVLNAYTQTPISVTKVTGSHTGTYAARIETVVVSPHQNNVPDTLGVLVTGAIITQPFPPSIKYGCAYAARPSSLTFWATYAPTAGDTAFAWVLMTKQNQAQPWKKDTVGAGFLPINTTGSYTQFTVPITYIPQWSMPDTAIIYFSSSKLWQPKKGSVLTVDDVALSAPTSIEESAVYSKPAAYPNPANTTVTITTDKNSAFVNVYDVTGRMVSSYAAESRKTQINTVSYEQGIYIYRVVDKSNAVINTGKFTVAK